jgi:hypothetical protein
LWAHGKGGPALPEAVLNYNKALELRYLCNRFVVTKGEDKLGFFKLRESARSTNCVCACCFTTLIIDNANYNQKAVLIFPEVSALQTELPLEPITFVGFANDFPADKLDAAAAGDHPSPPISLIRQPRPVHSLTAHCLAPPLPCTSGLPIDYGNGRLPQQVALRQKRLQPLSPSREELMSEATSATNLSVTTFQELQAKFQERSRQTGGDGAAFVVLGLQEGDMAVAYTDICATKCNDSARTQRIVQLLGPSLFLSWGSQLVIGQATVRLTQQLSGGDPSIATSALTRMTSACAVSQFLLNPLLGKLSDVYGRKPMLMLMGLCTFCCRSATALSPSWITLIVGE